MMACPACDDDPRGVCFKHKIKTLNWGTVPGAYRATNSSSMYDKDYLKADGFNFSKEEVQDTRSDFLRRALESEG